MIWTVEALLKNIEIMKSFSILQKHWKFFLKISILILLLRDLWGKKKWRYYQTLLLFLFFF